MYTVEVRKTSEGRFKAMVLANYDEGMDVLKTYSFKYVGKHLDNAVRRDFGLTLLYSETLSNGVTLWQCDDGEG